MIIHFRPLGTFEHLNYKYAVTVAFKKNQLVLVRHKDRSTYELPGGRREPLEDINDTGRRELIEEAGALTFDIEPFCDYGVEVEGNLSVGRLFKASIYTFVTKLEHETQEVRCFDDLPDNLTYPQIIKCLVETVNLVQNPENINISTSQNQ